VGLGDLGGCSSVGDEGSETEAVLLLGEKDHWVADHTRDDLMRMRGRGESDDGWKPWMEIDKLEVPHGFCIDHSVPVADKVKEYLDVIVKMDAEGGSLF